MTIGSEQLASMKEISSSAGSLSKMGRRTLVYENYKFLGYKKITLVSLTTDLR